MTKRSRSWSSGFARHAVWRASVIVAATLSPIDAGKVDGSCSFEGTPTSRCFTSICTSSQDFGSTFVQKYVSRHQASEPKLFEHTRSPHSNNSLSEPPDIPRRLSGGGAHFTLVSENWLQALHARRKMLRAWQTLTGELPPDEDSTGDADEDDGFSTILHALTLICMLLTLLIILAWAMGWRLTRALGAVTGEHSGRSHSKEDSRSSTADSTQASRPGASYQRITASMQVPGAHSSPASLVHISKGFGNVQDLVKRQGSPSKKSVRLPTLKAEDMTCLCKDLVVPVGQECTLLVPKVRAGVENQQLHVCDLRYEPVFTARLPTGDPRGQRVILTSFKDDSLFGYCINSKAGEGLDIFNEIGARFGTLRADARSPRTWVASAINEHPQSVMVIKLLSVDGFSVEITDADDWLMATAELASLQERGPKNNPRGHDIRHVKIGQAVDAGYVLIVLLGIDYLVAAGMALPAVP